MSYRIGIDVGGTFTDFLVLGPDELRLVHKTSSTPDDPSRGVVAGLAEIAAQLGAGLEALLGEVEVIVHGTTVTTNAVLTQRGAKTGLVVTRGFRDVLALRDGTREAPYDNRLQPPVPLVPRRLRLGVAGRMDYRGEEAEPLADEDVRAAAEAFRREGVEAVAISFLHSPQNPGHERRALELLGEALPGVYVTASSDLLPQVRYYPRTSTTVLNAYVGPIITRYLEALTARLAELEFGGVLLVMQSNGGVATPGEVSRRAALSLLSGPASGPTAGLWQLEPHGLRDCITIDMGGTSFDAALVKGGEPLVMTDGLVDRWRLALPMIDIHTIGAGGGSIARVDEGGLLHVGPQSAGAVPGPACYGRGGTEPTTTDADLVLGFLDPATFLRGEMRLDREASERAIRDRIAAPLGLSLEAAAAGIHDLVNVTMAAGVREISVRRGLDPRDFPLVVAGGAGPLHAAAIAGELEIPLLVVPRESSIFCAAGMLMCDFKHDFVRAFKAPLADADPAQVAALLEEMAAAATAVLARERVAAGAVTLRAALDLRYVGQWHELSVPVAWGPGERPDLVRLRADFDAEHDRLFGYATAEMPVEALAVRLTAVGATAKPSLVPAAAGGEAAAARTGSRPVWSPPERRLADTPVYDGIRLGAGAALAGPAVIELANTTIVVPAGFEALVDRYGSFVLWHGERGRELAAALAPEAVLEAGRP
jgi:N-methylhydantoinase A